MILGKPNEMWTLTQNYQRGRNGRGDGEEGRKEQHLCPIVTIFGAGVAGLSVAHELIERGFTVQVVEPTRSPHEEYEVEVGGLARNQFGRVPEHPARLHAAVEKKTDPVKFRKLIDQVFSLRANHTQQVQPRFALPWRLRFERQLKPKTDVPSSTASDECQEMDCTGISFNPESEDEWHVRNDVKLRAVWEAIKSAYKAYDDDFQRLQSRPSPPAASPQEELPNDWRARERLLVEIRGHTNGDLCEQDNRRESCCWARAVLAELSVLNGKETVPLPDFDDHFRTVGVGSAEPLGDQRDAIARARSNRVEFRIVEQLIPGEHGYRFFPAFYRHLFDLMRRTPTLDKDGHATGQTAYDRLVPTADLSLAVGDGLPPEPVQTRRVRSIEELRRLSALFLGRLGVTPRDIARFQVRQLKFLTSSADRRRREYERQSWWTFIGGDAERGYSPRMRQYLMETSQALVAMNAEETDARSQGNIVSQLQLHYLEDQCDFTLNGPTSEVWLRPWKQYLKRQGVRFFIGELARLEWKENRGEFVPVTTDRSAWLVGPQLTTASPRERTISLAAKPGRLEAVVEVLDADDGDYTIRVSGVPYCFVARGRTRSEIAKHLAALLKESVLEAIPGERTIKLTVKGDASETVWVQVENSNDNLRIRDEPIPEDPTQDYLSHDEINVSSRPDFYVLALPLLTASKIVWDAETERPGQLHGCLAEILEFDRRTGRRTADGSLVRLIRDPDGRPPLQHPFRDFAGVQYYFGNQVRIGRGHVYFPRAEWGLSSISQLAYWRERMSPAAPFMGQLSVDVGNFYNPAPPRLGTRYARSAWNSSSNEIKEEVWFQVRQAHERDRAGSLAAPQFFHIDQALRFGDTRGSTFREEVRIVVRPPQKYPGDSAASGNRPIRYTVWVNDEPFEHDGGGTSKEIATALKTKIAKASFDSLSVDLVKPKEWKDPPRPGLYGLVIRSTVLQGAALLLVSGSTPGVYELQIGDRRYQHVATRPDKRSGSGNASVDNEARQRRGTIRDGLYRKMLREPHPAVTPRRSGETDLLLLPSGTADLPKLVAANDDQHLNIIYGPTLNIRLEQADGLLSFASTDSATIGCNETPFLINVPGQWQYRPGLFQPQELTFQETVLRPGEDERIRYRISNRRWVCAGTHMATTTQLTTMESASESARHAVNAILRCLAARGVGSDYNAQGRVVAELAEIWDPEENELDDLEPLKRLDRKLVEEGLPHVMDILKITDAVDALPMHGKPSDDPLANMLHLLQHLMDGSDRDWSFLKQSVGDLLSQAAAQMHNGVDPLGLLRELRNSQSNVADRIREFLQSLMKPPAGGASSGGTGAST